MQPQVNNYRQSPGLETDNKTPSKTKKAPERNSGASHKSMRDFIIKYKTTEKEAV